jgi:ERCC4-type nuclease
MWALILSFLKNPKNILLVILVAVIAVLTIYATYSKISLSAKISEIEKQKTVIASQKKDLETYKTIQEDLLKQMQNIQNTQQEQQKITAKTAEIMTAIKKLKTKCTMEKEDASSFNRIVDYFNNGVLSD